MYVPILYIYFLCGKAVKTNPHNGKKSGMKPVPGANEFT